MSLQNRVKRLEQKQGYIQPLIIIASSPAQEAELIQNCIEQNGRPPDKIVKLIAVEPGTMKEFYGGEPYEQG